MPTQPPIEPPASPDQSSIESPASPDLLILFDGVCNLCNSAVQFILKRDKSAKFHFASLQGRTGQEYLTKFGLPAGDLNSFVLVEKDRVYTRSLGALRVLKNLGRGWQLLYICRILPAFLRDGVYNYIAKHRYRWFGQLTECWIPTPELKERFLD